MVPWHSIIRHAITARSSSPVSSVLRVEASNVLRRLGHGVVSGIGRLGYIARFFSAIVIHSPHAFRRLHLTMREIYFSGVLSLVIILVSGLFVGMVLAIQGYDVLQRYGADESLGIMVAL